MGKIIGLGIDLTHRCNLNCSFCWKFVKQSTYEMTMDQVDRFCEFFAHIKPKKLRITGGEPLMHPQFKEVMRRLQKAFPDSLMQVTTNGLLLKMNFLPGVQYVITPYPENKGLEYPGKVTIYPRPRGYFDRDYDPNLSERRAKKVHNTCVYRQIRVIGDNVYDCCHAETMERIKGCEPIHVRVGAGWGKEFKEKQTEWWPECVHCFAGVYKKL